MKFLLDEGVPLRTAAALREQGVEAEHILELGLQGAQDEVVLGRAREANAIVVAFDSDFHRLLAASHATSPSVIRIRIDGLSYSELARLVLAVKRTASDALRAGVAVSVSEQCIRIRSLPLES